MQTDVLKHPAVKAWMRLQPDSIEPESIEILDRKQQVWVKLQSERAVPESIDTLDRKKRASIYFRSEHVQPEIAEILAERTFVYRLKGVGPEGSAVIAKQCAPGTGMIEHTIYREILFHLPVSSPYCYGFVEELGGEFCWLFLEDAGKDVFRYRIREHRDLATRWLGLMHTSAAPVAASACLPDRGPDYYLEHLQLARDAIHQAIANSPFSPDDLAILESVVSRCNVLESNWSKVEKFCDRMPQTLVHSDFKQSNIMVRKDQPSMALLPFDWEIAGWGIPAADLEEFEQADLAIYWSVVRPCWPHLDVQDIQKMANVGRIFRGLANMSWECLNFDNSWESIRHTVMVMNIWEVRIADAMRAATWED
jgi:hypothetical protein